MRALSAAELLDVWEQGSVQSPLERAITLLAAACPEAQPGALARLSIGQRDLLLLTLRQQTFGPEVAAIANCPDCDGQLELSFDTEDIRVSASVYEPLEPALLAVGDYELSFRLPNSLDLLAILAQGDAAAAREAMAERCLLSARKRNEEVPFNQLPETVLTEVDEQMSKLDPQANVQLALDCPGCRNPWSATFDILAFFWSELNAWAQRLLAEVHALASAYGWREADILEMSPARRNIYLDMASR